MSHHCGCRHDCGKIESTSAAVAGGVLQVTVIPLQTYVDYKYYELALCQALPARMGTEPVTFFDGVNAYPVLDTNAQPVVSGRMRGHKCYRIRYGAGGTLSTGTMPAHFTVYEGLCSMEYSANAALQNPIQEE